MASVTEGGIMKLSRLTALALLAATVGAAQGQTADTAVSGVELRWPLLLPAAGGTLGSAVGLAAGALIGYSTTNCEAQEIDGLCGFNEALLGGVVGSALASAAGAYVGAKMADVTPSVPRTVLGGFLGILAGFGTAALWDTAFGGGGVVAYTIGQGVVTGAAAGVWR